MVSVVLLQGACVVIVVVVADLSIVDWIFMSEEGGCVIFEWDRMGMSSEELKRTLVKPMSVDFSRKH